MRGAGTSYGHDLPNLKNGFARSKRQFKRGDLSNLKPKHSRTCRCCLLIGTCFSLVVAVLLSTPVATTQHQDPTRPGSVDLKCPSYAVSAKTPINLHADILDADDIEHLNIVLQWTVSNALIVSGQGTRNIVLNPAVKPGLTKIEIDVQAKGAPPDMLFRKSCVLTVDSDCSLAPLMDQYSNVSTRRGTQAFGSVGATSQRRTI